MMNLVKCCILQVTQIPPPLNLQLNIEIRYDQYYCNYFRRGWLVMAGSFRLITTGMSRAATAGLPFELEVPSIGDRSSPIFTFVGF
jgi:hypothetical protein